MKADAPPAILELEYFSSLQLLNEVCSLIKMGCKTGSENSEEILYGFCLLCF